MDGSGNVVMYLNNAQHVTGTLSAKSTDNARYALCLGGDAASAGSFTGNMMLAAGCNQVHTEAQRIAAHKWISARWMTTTDVACLGDSITALDQSPASNQTGINTLDWPTRMQNLLGTSYRVTNFAVSGAQVKGAQNLHGIKLGQLESTNGPYRTHYKIYTFLGGNNDIGVAGLTAAQTWDLPLASSGTGTQAVFDEITNDPSSYLFAGVCLPNKGSSTYWGVSNPQGVWTPGANGTQGIMDAYASYIQGYVPPSGNNNYTWVDTFTPFTTPGDTYTMLANGSFDGLHPRSPFSDVIAGIFALAILQKGLG